MLIADAILYNVEYCFIASYNVVLCPDFILSAVGKQIKKVIRADHAPNFIIL